ncbi:MAG TPA: CARDB domain-containing protein [Candidatus Paceibacterota bacterium]|nr:CARDB domain-containing protein [Candidatus Paceibacterota bacterium]
MNLLREESPSRQAAVYGLAATGFVALMALGMWLAVYSTRFVPSVVGRIGTAAVYLGSVFTPAPAASLSVVPAASTTIPFGAASSTISTSVSAGPASVRAPKPVVPSAGEATTGTYLLGATTTPPAATLSGLPDLVVKIDAVGYLATSSAGSFVASSTVPAGSRPAVTFTIKNVGTNATGAWRWSATIPAQTAYTYQSEPQQSLAPGDSIDYTMGFDQADTGADKVISITANFDKAVTESNMDNDSASTTVTVLGS